MIAHPLVLGPDPVMVSPPLPPGPAGSAGAFDRVMTQIEADVALTAPPFDALAASVALTVPLSVPDPPTRPMVPGHGGLEGKGPGLTAARLADAGLHGPSGGSSLAGQMAETVLPQGRGADVPQPTVSKLPHWAARPGGPAQSAITDVPVLSVAVPDVVPATAPNAAAAVSQVAQGQGAAATARPILSRADVPSATVDPGPFPALVPDHRTEGSAPSGLAAWRPTKGDVQEGPSVVVSSTPPDRQQASPRSGAEGLPGGSAIPLPPGALDRTGASAPRPDGIPGAGRPGTRPPEPSVTRQPNPEPSRNPGTGRAGNPSETIAPTMLPAQIPTGPLHPAAGPRTTDPLSAAPGPEGPTLPIAVSPTQPGSRLRGMPDPAAAQPARMPRSPDSAAATTPVRAVAPAPIALPDQLRRSEDAQSKAGVVAAVRGPARPEAGDRVANGHGTADEGAATCASPDPARIAAGFPVLIRDTAPAPAISSPANAVAMPSEVQVPGHPPGPVPAGEGGRAVVLALPAPDRVSPFMPGDGGAAEGTPRPRIAEATDAGGPDAARPAGTRLPDGMPPFWALHGVVVPDTAQQAGRSAPTPATPEAGPAVSPPLPAEPAAIPPDPAGLVPVGSESQAVPAVSMTETDALHRTAAAAPAAGSGLPSRVAPDLAAIVASRPEGPTEVTLAPEELGRVSLTLHPEGDAMRIVVLAERGDTLDLLRRHAELLLQEFRAAGFSGSTLSFGGWGGAANHSSPEGRAQPGPGAADAALPLFSPPPPASDRAGLDLRL